MYLGCTQRECEPNKFVDENREMFESKISAGSTEKKLHHSRKSGAVAIARSCDMAGHAEKCVELYCEVANKNNEQLFKV